MFNKRNLLKFDFFYCNIFFERGILIWNLSYNCVYCGYVSLFIETDFLKYKITFLNPEKYENYDC